jgi:hypothetical protein
MKLLLENWREYLNEQVRVGRYLYRIAKASKAERIMNSGIRAGLQSADTNEEYRNKLGQPEGRVYFFTDLDTTSAIIFSSPEDVEAIIGDVEKGDRFIVAQIDSSKLDPDLTFHIDEENEELLGANYAVHPTEVQWKISPDAIIKIYTEEDLLKAAEDEEYYQ